MVQPSIVHIHFFRKTCLQSHHSCKLQLKQRTEINILDCSGFEFLSSFLAKKGFCKRSSTRSVCSVFAPFEPNPLLYAQSTSLTMVDGGQKVGVFNDLQFQNQTNMESLNPNSNVESGGDYDVFHCHEAANKRIKLTPKVNNQQVAMAETLLNLQSIGLKLYNLPDLVNTTERRLVYSNHQARMTHHAKVDDHYSPQQMTEKEKLKASNFTATLLKIGSWERVTRNEGDLVAKCYYAKKKLVWEFLERGLKSKIEIQWSDILAMRADIEAGILEIELSKPPTFHEETDPQPRKHTIWRLTTDFTGGEASKWRRHYLRFPPTSLDKHYEKLLQCDSRLHAISQQRFPSLKSPIFESYGKYGFPGFSLDFNGQGVHMNHPEMHWQIPMFPQPDFVQNQHHFQSFMKPTPPSDEYGGNNSRMSLWGGNIGNEGQQTSYHHFHHHHSDETFVINRVQGIESIVSSTTPLNQNVSYTQNYSLVPYDQAVESSQMQKQLLSDFELYDNNYQIAPLDDHLDLSIEEANDQIRSGLDQFGVPYNVSSQSSQEDTTTHQLSWNNSSIYPSLLEDYEYQENNNQWG